MLWSNAFFFPHLQLHPQLARGGEKPDETDSPGEGGGPRLGGDETPADEATPRGTFTLLEDGALADIADAYASDPEGQDLHQNGEQLCSLCPLSYIGEIKLIVLSNWAYFGQAMGKRCLNLLRYLVHLETMELQTVRRHVLCNLLVKEGCEAMTGLRYEAGTF